MELKRPIAFIDIESTGLNVEADRILELCICKVFPDGSREVKTKRYNPEIPIPATSTEVHGITNDDVKDKPLFKQEAKSLLNYLDDCDLAGFNSNRFDVPMLFFEFLRAGLYLDYKKCRMIDVGNIFKIQEPRTLEAGVKFYLQKEHEGAHGAEADAIATADIFFSQLERYPDLPADLDELALFSNHGNKILDLSGKFIEDEDGNILLNFGKHKGEAAKDHLDFLQWMCYRASFPQDTVAIAETILQEAHVI